MEERHGKARPGKSSDSQQHAHIGKTSGRESVRTPISPRRERNKEDDGTSDADNSGRVRTERMSIRLTRPLSECGVGRRNWSAPKAATDFVSHRERRPVVTASVLHHLTRHCAALSDATSDELNKSSRQWLWARGSTGSCVRERERMAYDYTAVCQPPHRWPIQQWRPNKRIMGMLKIAGKE